MNELLYKYILTLSDNSMIIGHRLSELCGHGPSLETDIALTNISLDLFGEVRSYMQYAAQIKGEDQTEDTLAFLRKEREHYNTILVEQPNTDFAYVICRQFLFDVFHKMLLEHLCSSKDEIISAVANKSIKESSYHLRFSSEWMKRLGDGTEESHIKIQDAVQALYPFTHELIEPSEIEKKAFEQNIGPDISTFKDSYYKQVNDILSLATLTIPDTPNRITRGKQGIHSEHMGYILSEFQFMQRAYPNMQW